MNAAIEHVIVELEEGHRISASRAWGIGQSDFNPDTDTAGDATESNWTRAGCSAYKAAECAEIYEELGVSTAVEINDPNIQATAGRSDLLAGGPLAGWYIGRLCERTEDGRKRSREFIKAQFRLWQPFLAGVGDGPHAREYMATRLDGTPTADDMMLLRAADARDLRNLIEPSSDEIPVEFRGLKLTRKVWRALTGANVAVACRTEQKHKESA